MKAVFYLLLAILLSSKPAVSADSEMFSTGGAAVRSQMPRVPDPTSAQMPRIPGPAPAPVSVVSPATNPANSPPIPLFKPELSEFDKKRLDKADAEIAQHPDSAEGYMDRAYVYNLFFPEKAIPEFSKVIELEPNNLSALQWRAKAYTTTKQYDQAMTDYSRIIQIKPTPDAYYDQGSILHYCLKQPEKAIPYYNASIGLDAFNSKAFGSRGRAELDLGQNDQALNDLTTLAFPQL